MILERLVSETISGDAVRILIGAHWTAAVFDTEFGMRCGLASTIVEGHNHEHHPDILSAGKLENLISNELLSMCFSESMIGRSVGVACLNALLPPIEEGYFEDNAEGVLSELAQGKRVVLVGHFPFVKRLQNLAKELHVLEQNPSPGDLPADAAAEVIPNSEVIAITGMTLVNHTLEKLLPYCPKDSVVILLGPSTPLTKSLFNFNVDIVSGSIVRNIDSVLLVISQGGNFRQVSKAGVRLVNVVRPGYQLKLH